MHCKFSSIYIGPSQFTQLGDFSSNKYHFLSVKHPLVGMKSNNAHKPTTCFQYGLCTKSSTELSPPFEFSRTKRL